MRQNYWHLKFVIKHFDCRDKIGNLCDISNEAVEKRLEQFKRAERKFPPAAFRVLKNFYNHMVNMKNGASLDLQEKTIQLPAIYEDYIECDYWSFILMCIKDFEKEMNLYKILEGSFAFYDDKDMVVFVESANGVAYAEAGKAAILSCLERYANSPVKNIEMKVAILRQFSCYRCGNSEFSSAADFCIICSISALDMPKYKEGKVGDVLTYNDGPIMDANNKLSQCPVCENNEFSADALHCRICGIYVINHCEGVYDDYNRDELIYHENPSNARFCEACGKKTRFFLDGILKPWEEVQGIEPAAPQTPTPQTTEFADLTTDVDDDDLPF